MKRVRAEQPPVSVTAFFKVRKFLNEATIDLVLLAAVEQLEDQTTARLLIIALEEYEDSGTAQKEDVNQPKCNHHL